MQLLFGVDWWHRKARQCLGVARSTVIAYSLGTRPLTRRHLRAMADYARNWLAFGIEYERRQGYRAVDEKLAARAAIMREGLLWIDTHPSVRHGDRSEIRGLKRREPEEE